MSTRNMTEAQAKERLLEINAETREKLLAKAGEWFDRMAAKPRRCSDEIAGEIKFTVIHCRFDYGLGQESDSLDEPMIDISLVEDVWEHL